MIHQPVSAGSASEWKSILVTHVDEFGPYLRITGQHNHDAMNIMRKKLQLMVSSCIAIDPTWPIARQQMLLGTGALCIYKCVTGAAAGEREFQRACIHSFKIEAGRIQVEVEIIDYGYKKVVPSFDLFFPPHTGTLSEIPSLCSQYILLGIYINWNGAILKEILLMILNQIFNICIWSEFKNLKFITMQWKDFNFADFLINQKQIGTIITNEMLCDNISKMWPQQEVCGGMCTILPTKNLPNNNNNNVFYTNKNNDINKFYNNNNQQEINSTPIIPLTPSEQARLELASRRSLAGRLQKIQHQNTQQVNQHQLPAIQQHQPTSVQQQQPIQQLSYQSQSMYKHQHQPVSRLPQNISNLTSLMHGINSENGRIPYTGPYYSEPNAHSVSYHAIPNIIQPQYSAPGYGMRYQQPIATRHESLVSTQSIRTSPATFRSNNLIVGQVYDVCISYVENGPNLFSVQLSCAQDELTKMMTSIEEASLKPFNDKPTLGSACIARYAEDGQLYRALITGVQPTVCKVAYIDYGNAEFVDFNNLFEIPDEFLNAKAYAVRFKLSGNSELEPIDESLKRAFKDLVIYKNCKLRVMPLEGPPLVQYGELYLQDKNILNVLKQIQKCRLVYPKAEPLHDNDVVEIRYIDSPKHFYVQKTCNINEFETLMDELYTYYNKNQVVPNNLTLGAPCIVKYEKEWYRAEVMRVDSTAIVVRHVDFGYSHAVTRNLISTIAECHLKLPRQAVQCCLKGFENRDLNKDLATTQFEMLAEESNLKRRAFSVKVFRLQPDGGHLINLCTRELNVMKKLYKLSMPFELYLTLEKEDFNQRSNSNALLPSAQNENVSQKTPSIDLSCLGNDAKKDQNIINSTTLLSDDRMQKQQQEQEPQQVIQQPALQQKQLPQQQTPQEQEQQKRPQKQEQQKSAQQEEQQKPPQQQKKQLRQSVQHRLVNINNSNYSEWDRTSSAASSIDNRDSRSSSSENKRGRRQQQRHNVVDLNNSLDQLSTNGSISSSSASCGNNKVRKNNNGAIRAGPHLKTDNMIRRKNKQHSRSQNSRQGYAQSLQNTCSTPDDQKQDDADSLTGVIEEYVPLTHTLSIHTVALPAKEDIIISWWISPHQFYVQLMSRLDAFLYRIIEMQRFYKHKSLQQLPLKVGSLVAARQRRDDKVYRGRILACNQMLRRYKVHCFDYGHTCTVTSEDLWQLESRFAKEPPLAYLCSFSNVISNFEQLYILERMEKYLANASLKCEFIEYESNMYYVNVNVNGMSLRKRFLDDGLITEVCPEFRLELLAGQQIRVKITSVVDMLNFKIEFEGCDVKLLSSYADVRYVKSNADIAKKFKEFYENKSCVVNIEEVNDNKVVLLRPLLPLLKEDIPTSICSYPITLQTFDAHVVYVACATRLYVQPDSVTLECEQLLEEMFKYYENEGTALKNCDVDGICAAKSGDWYRARIINKPKSTDESVEVYYIDYGNTEIVERTKLKQLEERFYLNKSAYAIEVNLPMKLQNSANKKSNAEENSDEILQKLSDLIDVSVKVQALEVRNNHLIAEISNEDNFNLLDSLKVMGLKLERDLEYVRRALEKQPSNMLVYIETVDLTLDEDELEKLHTNKIKNNASKQQPPSPSTHVAITEEKIEKLDTEAAVPSPIESKEELPIVAPIEEKISHEMPVAAIVTDEPNQTPTDSNEVQTNKDEIFVKMEHAYLSHCVNPTQFYVHPVAQHKNLQELQDNLQIVASLLPPLVRIHAGAHCIALYSMDKQWYRGKILDSELLAVQFIDYGNSDCITDVADIKEMNTVLPELPPFCIHCALPIQPSGSVDWVDAVNTIFNDSYDKVLDYEYLTAPNLNDCNKRCFVNLHIEGINVAQKLIDEGLAKPLELVSSGETCFISHVNSMSDFYLQYEKDSKGLELIEIYLADNEKLSKLVLFERGKIVAALFADDGMWYRAKLLTEIPTQGFEVLFIDYGNTAISPECREISSDIAQLKPLSKKCALELPAHCLGWSDSAEEKFAVISGLGETIFTVDLCEPKSDHAVVQLFIDGISIIDDLAPLCDSKPTEPELNASFANTTLHTSICENGTLHDAIISHTNSPCDFYIQFERNVARLEDMVNSLNTLGMEPLQDPQLDQLCAAVFVDDDSLYRARILQITEIPNVKLYRVLFIDYGNESFTSDLRTLPQDLQELKPFAKHCQLENSVNFQKNVKTATEAFKALLNQCGSTIKLDIVDDTVTPAIVKVFAANLNDNLCESLNALLSSNATKMPNPDVQRYKANTCQISHAISPSEFYIQLKKNSYEMEQISVGLKNLMNTKMPLLTNPKLETVCSVFVPEDNCYYRGRVLSVLQNNYDIFLIDYGYCVTATELRELPAKLCSIPMLAHKCQLNAIPDGIEQNVLNDCFAALLESHFGDNYEIDSDIVDNETNLHTVKLQVNYQDLAEELAAAVKPGAVQVVATPELHNCSIIHVNSSESFYIQLANDVTAVENITDCLINAAEKFEPLKERVVGMICAAQFPDDEAFYRAEIIEVMENEEKAGIGYDCKVQYIDFGNSSVTGQLLQLPEDMIKTPAYSKHCALDVKFSDNLSGAKFAALIETRFAETFQVEFLRTSTDLNICRLFYQDKNVADELQQINENGRDVSNDTWQSSLNPETVNPSSGIGSMEEENGAIDDA